MEKEDCYDAVPIKYGFVKPYSRVLTKYSAKTPCNSYFGLKIHTVDGTWIEINPQIKTIPKPGKLPLFTHDLEHEDMVNGGIYTDKEKKAWTEHIELGDYHNALTKTQSYENYGPNQDGNSFQTDASWNQVLQLNPLEKITMWIEKWGSYICLAALIIELGRFACWSFAIFMAIFYEGIAGLKKLLYWSCCHRIRFNRTIDA